MDEACQNGTDFLHQVEVIGNWPVRTRCIMLFLPPKTDSDRLIALRAAQIWWWQVGQSRHHGRLEKDKIQLNEMDRHRKQEEQSAQCGKRNTMHMQVQGRQEHPPCSVIFQRRSKRYS